ncbi:TlpA disulfide reductase family protein [Parabacteroides sp. PF5-6]|uniref:TlpA family protein disulfide reductase n=1 Tax=Parabacteroides sp. PF5-6 TaxID=1742403 RepID=UPI0024050C51|nr:TlpA disulfide reductase family protein [Parabacteroides sp. PF5-6]MDF9829021.1 thiol-disulfide isomerase/thioredoxin [Parabacteroides sp. PF5-6]
MKQFHYLLILFFSFFFVQCQNRADRVIERPVYGFQNNTTLEIDKVELTDSATILYVDAYFYPNNWIRIDSATYIRANGKNYTVQGAEGIVLHAEHWMPDTGEDHFKLFFPPIPKNTKSIDFIESDCADCFKIWDIDLTGKAGAYRPDLPQDILQAEPDRTTKLETPELKMGKTKVSLFVTGLVEGYEPSSRLSITDPFSRQRNEVDGKKEADGKYVFEIDQYTTSPAFLMVGQSFEILLLEPGEEAEVYFDLKAYARKSSRYHPQPEIVYAGYRGHYADVNNQLLTVAGQLRDYEINVRENYALLNLNAADFIKALIALYKEKRNEIDQSAFSTPIKQFLAEELKSSLVNTALNMPLVYESLYRRKNKIDYNEPIDFKIPALTDKELLLLKEIGLNDRNWIYSTAFPYAGSALATKVSSETVLNELTGSENGLLQDLRKSIPAMTQAINREPLKPEMESALASASSPYFTQMYKHLAETVKKQYEAALSQGGFTIQATPEVAGDKLLDAIIAEYKGKVVFVDFWATWCGPCLNAMKTIKPFKPEMAEKGVVSIYITNTSSPQGKWTTMLPEIGGLHYYLKGDQWQTLSDKYDIQGIPTYMIFDKNGNKVFEATGYPGNDKIKEELSKVW